jgi:hypothetical protein
MAAYFRMAHNIEAERQASEIRIRAERKGAQLYDAQEKAKGTQGQLAGRSPSGGPVSRPPEDNTKTLAEHGVTKQEMSEWRKLAAVSDDQFEAALAAPGIPTREGVIQGTEEPALQIIDETALWVWGQIREAGGCLFLNPGDVRPGGESVRLWR